MKLKWILTGLAALVVAVVVAAYAVLASLDLEEYRDVIQAEARKATGRDLTLAGAMDLKVSLTPAITVEDVQFGNADWGSRPEMVKLKRFEVEAALMPLLSGTIQVKRLILIEPDILLETDAAGRGNWELPALAEAAAEGETEAAGELPSLGFDRVLIEGGQLTYRDGASGQEVKIALDSLEAQASDASSPINLALAGRYNDNPFEAEGVFGSFEQLNSGPFPIKLTAKAGGATLSVDGAIADPKAAQGIDLKISAEGDSLADLGELAGTELPPLGPYAFASGFSQEGEAFKLSGMTLKVGGSDIAGDLTASLAGGRPTITGSFNASLLDMNDFAPAGGDAAGGEAAQGETPSGAYLFTEDPLPLDGLRAADAEIALKAARVRLKDAMEVTDVDVTLKLQDGHLAIEPLNAVLSDGQIAGVVDLDATVDAPPLHAVLTIDGLDYGKLLKSLGIDDTVAGTMDVDVDVRGAGGSMRAIAASLNGRGEVVSDKGVINQKLLKVIAGGLDDVLGSLIEDREDAKLNCMVARFTIQNGVATSQALITDTEVFTVSGGGTIDLRAEELDLSFDTETREASIASLAVPFNVTGRLNDPLIAPDPLGTALEVAKTAGVVINPVVGLGALIGGAIIEGVVGEEENPCVAALGGSAGAAPAAQPASGEAESGGVGEAVEGAAEEAAGAVEDAVESVGEGLKSLFGD